MSPLDLSVLFFFVLITGKALSDSFKFWKEQDEAAAIAYELASRKPKPAHNTVYTAVLIIVNLLCHRLLFVRTST